MAEFNSSIITQPFNISVVTNNGSDELRRLVAPSWVSTPNVRGTMDILQSCVLTLVACIYTALHLDVPDKTTWQYLLWEKAKWVLIALFAPELALFVAASQLRYAWDLRSALRKIQKEKQASNRKPEAEFEINLKYAFCIVMGAVRFDVHDILSLADLNESDHKYFEDAGRCRRSVRPGPAAIIHLAERGYWIQIPKQDIDDKSKADTIQKTLVLIQVLWMVIQCVARRMGNLPISFLKIHTIVHVVCAFLLYACWFEKPLNIQEAMIIETHSFKGDIAAMLQRHFYSEVSCRTALFEPKEGAGASPLVDFDGSPMQWVEPQIGMIIHHGNVLPSGLALSKSGVEGYDSIPYPNNQVQITARTYNFALEHEFLARWDAILTTFSFDRGTTLYTGYSKTQDSAPQKKAFFLPCLRDLEPKLGTDSERLFWEGESIIHLDIHLNWGGGVWKESTTESDMKLFSPRFVVLAASLSGLYGGVHLTIWGQAFPSYVEELMWKISCFFIIGFVPFSLVLSPVAFIFRPQRFPGICRALYHLYFVFSLRLQGVRFNAGKGRKIGLDLFYGFYVSISLGYIAARVFIIVESFLSLRRSPVRVFLSPEWVELFPHF